MATERAQKILEKWDQEKNAIERAETKSSIDDQKKIQVKIEPELDYMQQALDHKLKYGGTLVDAMRWVERNYPHKLREYIKKHNS